MLCAISAALALSKQIGLWCVAMCALKAGENAASSLKLVLGKAGFWPNILLALAATFNLFCIALVRSLLSPRLPYLWDVGPLLTHPCLPAQLLKISLPRSMLGL